MRVDRLLVATGEGGFFCEDQAAIRGGARLDGDRYIGTPVTPGFRAVREPAAACLVGLLLENGSVAWGDGMSVQYPGVAGREPPLDAEAEAVLLAREVAPRLAGRELDGARTESEALDRIEGLHPGTRYALSQALLAAAAHASGVTMAEVVCREYGIARAPAPVPVYAQSGERRYENVDRMIQKRVDAMPHGLVNSPDRFGPSGEAFLAYVRWVADRVGLLGENGYRPTLHFDVYGMPGRAFDLDVGRVARFLLEVERAAAPYPVRVEHPADFGSTTWQIEGCATIRREIRDRGGHVGIVADEWCNSLADIERFASAGAVDMIHIKTPDLGGLHRSIAAVEACHAAGTAAFLGGSCTETDISARATVHVAMATHADLQLAKPGMGVDEGLAIVRNEARRVLAEVALRRGGQAAPTLGRTT